MNRGVPPTLRKARTGLLTPPGIHCWAAQRALRIPGVHHRRPLCFVVNSAQYSWTKSTSRRTLSTGVCGRIPWPRLKMWPVPARRCGAVEHPPGALAQLRPRRKEHHRVEVALNRHVAAQPLPASGQVDPPVDADDVAAGLTDQRQHAAGVGAKVNDRHAGLPRDLDRPPAVGQHQTPVVVRAELAHPTVEQLQRLRSGPRLRQQVLAHNLGSASPSTAPTAPVRSSSGS